jgi:hypothetical protein
MSLHIPKENEGNLTCERYRDLKAQAFAKKIELQHRAYVVRMGIRLQVVQMLQRCGRR